MLELLDLESTVDRETYRERLPQLQLELRRLQWEAKQRGIAVLILVEAEDKRFARVKVAETLNASIRRRPAGE